MRVINEQQLVEGRSFRAACAAAGVGPAQARSWKKQHQEIVHSNPSGGSVHKGQPSVLNDIKEDILFCFFELHERGMKISARMIMLKACELAPEL